MSEKQDLVENLRRWAASTARLAKEADQNGESGNAWALRGEYLAWTAAADEVERLTEREKAIREAFIDILANLTGAASAYDHFAGNKDRPGVRDALYSTRKMDFENALERGRKAWKELFDDDAR